METALAAINHAETLVNIVGAMEPVRIQETSVMLKNLVMMPLLPLVTKMVVAPITATDGVGAMIKNGP